jgi:peptidyl-prolyl cis-trans isomerase C
VKASHILVKLPEKATPEQEKAALDKIKAIEVELKGGKDFEEVATRMSEGPSAPKGGDLGFFGAGQMVKPFEEKAFAMKVGEVSGPVRTRFGFHIIKVVDKREERKKTFEEVKDQIEQSLKNKKFFQERRALLETLEKEAKIEKFIAEPPPAPAGAPEGGSDHEGEAPAVPEPAGGGE